MAECAIMKTTDDLEAKVREFLASNPAGGRLNIPFIGIEFLAVAVTLGIFEEEGWECEYDYDEDDQEWLKFNRPETKQISYDPDPGDA